MCKFIILSAFHIPYNLLLAESLEVFGRHLHGLHHVHEDVITELGVVSLGTLGPVVRHTVEHHIALK